MTDHSKEHADVHPLIKNEPAPGVSYFTPKQDPPHGVAFDPQSDGSHPPKLFQPLTIRGVTLPNRIFLSPLCQYSADNGHHTMWHLAHLGGIVSRGTGIALVEATSVTPQGRITPEDSGLWQDSQMEPLKRIVEFAHSQNQHIAIQLGHAGRKASTVAPWLSSGAVALEEANGWPEDVWAPSAVAFSSDYPQPKALTIAMIQELKAAFVASVKRAVAIGFDAIEIHSAHGYMFHEFLSPVSNKRTDEYGGSFENRIRLLIEIVDETRKAIPKEMPLFVRISATDWLEELKDEFPESWDVAQSSELAEILAEHGVDLLDVSSGGLHPSQKVKGGPAYQAPFAKDIKKAVGDKILVTSVGAITDGKLANELLEEGGLDAVFVGRYFVKEPGLVWRYAEDLGVEINSFNQIRWGFHGRAGKNAQRK